MSQIKEQIFEKVKEYFESKTEHSQEKIGVAYPCFDHNEVNSALDSLLDVWISQGPKVKKFESNFADYIGIKFGIACNSGSSANLLALTSLIQSGYLAPGDEVIVPASTFTTVISPILQTGLVPVFVDVELDTYNICPDSIIKSITDKTKLIMVVHSLGCPAKMDQIMSISNQYKIPIMEDCCEAHGSSISGKRIGSFGLVSTFSFFVAHNMTTGEGGMIMTNDEELYDNLRSVREFGRLVKYKPNQPRFYYTDEKLQDYDERYVFTNIGYNLRMTDIAASLGIEQLKKLDHFNDKRVKLAKQYTQQFKKYENYLTLPTTPDDFYHSFYGYPIVLKENNKFSRKDLVNHLEANGIETRAFMGGDLSIQPAYRNTECKTLHDMPNTKLILKNAFFIGCHPFINDEQVERIVNSFNSFFKTKEGK